MSKKIKINFKMPPESAAERLDRRFQELRKKRGAPDPKEYLERIARYNKELGMKKEETDLAEADLMSPAETYKKLAVKHLRDSMNKSATQKQRDYARIMNRRALEASKMSNHTDALNHYRGMKEEVEQIDEVGNTAKGQKMLTKVHKRAVNRMIKAIDTKDPKTAKKNQDTANRAWDRFDVKEEAELDEGWGMGNRNPQRGVKVGDKVRSYDFPGMHDDHYIEGHVVADNPHTYHIRVNKVVRSGKEIPVPAHMQHVEAPKGRGMFSNAYAVHKMMAKQQSVTAAPEPATGAQKTFGGMRNRLREAAGYWGKKSASDIEKIKKALEKERKQAASNPGALTKKKPPSRVKKDVQFYDYMAKTKT